MPRVSTDRAARWLAAGEAEDTTSGYSSLFIVLFLLFHIQLFSYFFATVSINVEFSSVTSFARLPLILGLYRLAGYGTSDDGG